MPPDVVAIISRDPELIADVRRLCAAAGQELQVVAQHADVHSLRRRVGVLLVDAASPDLADAGPERSPAGNGHVADVIVLTSSPDAVDPWRTAVRSGARQVLTLPDDSRRLLDALALAREGTDSIGPMIAVVNGSGGVGASTFAAALAWAAATGGSRTTLVDLDPWGGGLDLLLALEAGEGLRWPDLTEARGVVPAVALHERLPRVGQLGVVSCGRLPAEGTVRPSDLSAVAATAVVAAARRGDGAVVVDVPRWRTDAADAVLGASDVVFAVVAAEVRGIAAAALTINRVAALCDDVHVVLGSRSHTRLGTSQISDCLRRPVAATLAADSRLAAAADRGEFTAALARSSLGSTAKELWARFGGRQ